jgi:glycosyltransferase involved in cell wall biosynthesis
MSFRVVVRTPDVVGERMAGPGIRAWQLARELAKHFQTTLIAKREGPLPADDVAILELGTDEAREAKRAADVLVGQPSRRFTRLRARQRMVYDLFDPTVLELRELYGQQPSLRQRVHLAAEWWRLAHALVDADLLISAAPNQKRFYETLRAGDAAWIEVPFGVDPQEWSRCGKPRANVVIWGGGVWEWLDPGTAVEAILRLNREGLDARLLFLGRSRPNRTLVDRRREDRFERLLEVGRPFVGTNEEWVPYRERLSWLCSGKVAIMLHRRTAEAGASIRTRLFDAIASATPVVTTEGGFAADLVKEEGLGFVVPPEDPGAVAAAIRTLLTDDEIFSACVQSLERIRPRYAWATVTRPLVDAIHSWQT